MMSNTPAAGSNPRYLGNRNTDEVHDLLHSTRNCQIPEIKPEHRVPFQTLEAALRAGYNRCKWCLGS